MQRFILSSLSVLLVAAAVAPSAKALDTSIDTTFNLHNLRLEEFDRRSKKGNEKSFDLHQLRTAELESRNKVGDKVSTTPLLAQRHLVLNRAK
jgi:hypothetical protein